MWHEGLDLHVTSNGRFCVCRQALALIRPGEPNSLLIFRSGLRLLLPRGTDSKVERVVGFSL